MGCDLWCLEQLCAIKISIHAPARGATANLHKSALLFVLSIYLLDKRLSIFWPLSALLFLRPFILPFLRRDPFLRAFRNPFQKAEGVFLSRFYLFHNPSLYRQQVAPLFLLLGKDLADGLFPKDHPVQVV